MSSEKKETHSDIGKRVKSAESPRIYRCDFARCHLTFPTLKQLKTHKEADPNHDYCRKCDLNFPHWDSYIQHRYAHPAHKDDKAKICPICGAQFGSNGGRAKHIALMHPVKHNVTCVGCNATFREPSGYINHIEKGKCPHIQKSQLQSRIQHKKTIQKLLDNPESAGSDGDTPSVVTPASSLKPGKITVGTPRIALDDETEYPSLITASRAKMPVASSLPPFDPPSLSALPQWDSINLSGPDSNLAHVEQWARDVDVSFTPPGDDHPQSWALDTGPKTISVPVANTVKDTFPAFMPPETGMVVAQAFPWSSNPQHELDQGINLHRLDLNDHVSHQDSDQLLEDCEESNLFRLHFWDPSHPKFDVDRLYSHRENKYLCPHPDCCAQYSAPQLICEHLRRDHISRMDHRCPECRRKFQSIAALVAHVTSGVLKKCKIQKRKRYLEKLALITGGFVSGKDKRRDFLEGGGSVTQFQAGNPIDLNEEIKFRPRETVVVGRKV